MNLEKMKLQSRSDIVIPEILITIAVGILIGLLSSLIPPALVILLLAGCAFAMLALGRNELFVLGYLVFTSTVIADNYNPSLNVGAGTIYFTDVILLMSFGLVLLRAFVEPGFKPVHTPIDVPMIGFWAVALFSTALAILGGAITLKDSLGGMRAVTSYLTFFLVTNLVRKERQINFLWGGIIAFALVTALAMAAQYIVGPSIALLPGRVETLTTEGVTYANITRIIPPGESIIFVGFVILTLALILDPKRRLSLIPFLAWALLGMGVILTYKRHYFIALGLIAVLMFLIVRSREKTRLLNWSAATIFVGVVLVFFISFFPSSKAMRFVSSFSDRVLSVTQAQTYEDPNSSLQWRSFEYQYALPQIESHLFFGVGLSTIYRPFVQGKDWLPDGDFRRFVHNGHLSILLKSGLLGYLFFFILSFLMIFRGLKYWGDIPDVRYRALVLGLTLAYGGLMIGTIASPIVLNSNWTPVLGVMFGTNEVIYNLFDVKSLRAKRLEIAAAS